MYNTDTARAAISRDAGPSQEGFQEFWSGYSEVDQYDARSHGTTRQRKDNSETARQRKNNSEEDMTPKVKRSPHNQFSSREKSVAKEN